MQLGLLSAGYQGPGIVLLPSEAWTRTHPRKRGSPQLLLQFKVFGISGPVCLSDPGIGAIVLDKGRAIFMNTIQGTKSTPKTVDAMLQSLAGAALNAVKQPVLNATSHPFG